MKYDSFPGLDSSRPIQAEDVAAGWATPEGFLIENFFQIISRQGKDIPFILNDEQRKLDYAIAQRIRAGLPVKFFIPKARRRGISAYITARFTAKCNTVRNIDAAVVAHREKEVKKLFSKVDYYIDNFRGAAMKIGTDSIGEKSFPRKNSSIGVFTAGSKEVARGLDCNHLHLSEAAFYENPKSLVASLVQTIPGTGEVFVESTGNGQGTWYHRRCARAWMGKSSYAIIFFPWHTAEDTVLEVVGTQLDKLKADFPNPEFGEEDLVKEHPDIFQDFNSIPWDRVAWRRDKIDEFDYDPWAFKQEHPMTFNECFIPTARSFFHKYTLISNDSRWKNHGKDLYALAGHPHPSYHYAMGVDVSAGIGEDAASVQILCLETGEQVCELTRDDIPPDELPIHLVDLGKKYNWPLLVVESNNHGIVTMDRLINPDSSLTEDQIYPSNLIYWDDTTSNNIVRGGFRTTQATKPLWMGNLRHELAQGNLTIFSEELAGELGTFTSDLQATEGCHDDRVMALCMAQVALHELPNYVDIIRPEVMSRDPITDPFSFGTLFSGSEFEAQPLAPQTEYEVPTGWLN